MHLSEILTISGKPGLYTIVAQSSGRVIVESVEDGKRMPVFMQHNFSILNDISMYTQAEDVPLGEVFKNLYEAHDGKASISHKSSNEELEAEMAIALPDYDKEEVRHGDMRKLFKWYNILVAKSLWTPADLKKAEPKSGEEEE